jgi:hypothetical protein
VKESKYVGCILYSFMKMSSETCSNCSKKRGMRDEGDNGGGEST